MKLPTAMLFLLAALSRAYAQQEDKDVLTRVARNNAQEQQAAESEKVAFVTTPKTSKTLHITPAHLRLDAMSSPVATDAQVPTAKVTNAYVRRGGAAQVRYDQAKVAAFSTPLRSRGAAAREDPDKVVQVTQTRLRLLQ